MYIFFSFGCTEEGNSYASLIPEVQKNLLMNCVPNYSVEVNLAKLTSTARLSCLLFIVLNFLIFDTIKKGIKSS